MVVSFQYSTDQVINHPGSPLPSLFTDSVSLVRPELFTGQVQTIPPRLISLNVHLSFLHQILDESHVDVLLRGPLQNSSSLSISVPQVYLSLPNQPTHQFRPPRIETQVSKESHFDQISLPIQLEQLLQVLNVLLPSSSEEGLSNQWPILFNIFLQELPGIQKGVLSE